MDVRKMFGVYDCGIDGRATPVLKGVYAKESQAGVVAGAYRSVSAVWAVGPTDAGKWYLLQQPQPVELGVDFDRQRAEAKARALAKLSPEERAALGIVDPTP